MPFNDIPSSSVDNVLTAMKSLAEREKISARTFNDKIGDLKKSLYETAITKENFQEITGQLVRNLKEAQYSQHANKLNFENLVYDLYEIIGEQE